MAYSMRSNEQRVTVPMGRVALQGALTWPKHPSGLVLFVHGSGAAGYALRSVRARTLLSVGARDKDWS